MAPLLSGPSAVPRLPTYIAYQVVDRPEIDGRLTEAAWQAAVWSTTFVDIEGAGRPAPELRTRMKMLWDRDFLYIGAEIEEPHVWGTLVERDSVIFQDDDFELFLDPDGDTHHYYELEINALGTEWDLLLEKPYRDGGPARNEWDIPGLETAVNVSGTLNDPTDLDEGWSVEIALPWNALQEPPPRDMEQWRINFSRVDWIMDHDDGTYRKVTDPATGQALPERNWVWSQQGAIDMHRPEMWGIVQFSSFAVAASGPRQASFRYPDDVVVRWAMREIYHAQKTHFEKHAAYAMDLPDLDLPFEFSIETDAGGYEATATVDGNIWHIQEDGRIWREGTP